MRCWWLAAALLLAAVLGLILHKLQHLTHVPLSGHKPLVSLDLSGEVVIPAPVALAPTFAAKDTIRTAQLSHSERLEDTLLLCQDACLLPRQDVFLKAPPPLQNITRADLLARFIPARHHSCPSLFDENAERLLDLPSPIWPPPYKIPSELRNAYSMNGSAQIFEGPIIKKKYSGASARQPTWTYREIERLVSSIPFYPTGTYGSTAGKILLQALREAQITNFSVLVVGSENPWVEATALATGARLVTTLEYGKIVSEHPRIKTFTANAFNAAQRNGTLGIFDAIVSYSSLEHAGLGRYGDLLNPWADILAMVKFRCVLRPSGLLILGLPALNSQDAVYYNQHRSYGLLRWPLMLQGFRVEQEIRYDRYSHALVVARRVDV